MNIGTIDHPHRRFNPLSGKWVLVSPQRAKRPWLGQVDDKADDLTIPYDSGCYLCPGNVRVNGAVNARYDSVFVFENDFAPIETQSSVIEISDALFVSEPASGTCRVICFSPDHSKSLPELSHSGVRAVIDCWAAQSAELGKTHVWVQLFENKGAVMGCSNPHPHGQVWATHHVPDEVLIEDQRQLHYYSDHGVSMLMALAQAEGERAERVVVHNDHWIAVVPYWASWPFETLLLPRFAVQRMNDMNGAQRSDLAHILRELTARYDNLFRCRFPYSMGWHGAPFTDADHRHWQLHAHFYPPLLRSATVRKFMVGYEMLAEPQRDMTAEQAAAMLRAVSGERYQ